MAIQLRDVLFHIRIVWSSEADIYGGGLNTEHGTSVQSIAYDPRHFMVKLYSSNIVKVTMQGKETTSTLGADVYHSEKRLKWLGLEQTNTYPIL
jgi:hypothetical protein